MTDPIAEAAANLNAQPATDPSLFEEIKDTIHDLEEKVEHLIHPEATHVAAEPTPVAAGGADAAPVADVAPEVAAPSTEPVASAPVVEEQASTIAPVEAGNAEAASAAVASTVVEASAPSEPAPVASEGNAAPAAAGPSSEEPASVAADLPNAAIAAAEQPVTPLSAPDASMPAGIVGTVESSVEPAPPTSGVRAVILGHIANIRNHLSVRGFELSAVADIHNELAAIEKWL